ncbi:MATE family efflux transporter [Paenibacillus aceris]|uniref:MATE family efflux protein n=1 Tax=Paenibacillus aceris TaxID=869555 RepID=A0ABS4HR40_9BACL|nr:MATE family efflux transporter [Paenibacillus aceris]MBP1960881.1 putative MATE family efflux protein [Paenibacillus aceris]NHW35450.1 MATE family efflux transporter [Paenibacillus aceris]
MTNPKKLGLFAITWPLFIESSLQVFMRTSDTFIVSHVSDEAVAAVGVSNQLIIFLFLLLQVISTGSAIVISQYLGANKIRDVKKFAAGAISLNCLFGVLISMCIVCFSKQLLQPFGLEPGTLEQARLFLTIVGGSLFIQAVNLTIGAITQVHGYTRYTMTVSMGINLVNLTGSILCIFGPLGFPKLGVPGVAISAVFSQLLGLVVYSLILRKIVRLNLSFSDFYKARFADLKKILTIGIPTAGSSLVYSVSQLMTTYFITQLGAEMLSTRIYTQNIMTFIIVLAVSLGRGTQIIIGRLVGAGEKEEAYRQLFRSLLLSLLLSLAAVTLTVLFRKQLIGMFTDNAEIITLGALLLTFGFLLEPVRCLNIVIGEALRAAGDARFILLVGVCFILGLCVPLTYWLGVHMGYGLVGMWGVFIMDEGLRGLLLLFRWRSRAWEKKVLVSSEEMS